MNDCNGLPWSTAQCVSSRSPLTPYTFLAILHCPINSVSGSNSAICGRDVTQWWRLHAKARFRSLVVRTSVSRSTIFDLSLLCILTSSNFIRYKQYSAVWTNMFWRWRAGLKPPRLASPSRSHIISIRAVSGSNQPATWQTKLSNAAQDSGFRKGDGGASLSRPGPQLRFKGRLPRPPNASALSSEALELERAIERDDIDPIKTLKQCIEGGNDASIGIIRVCLQTYRSLKLVDLSYIERLDQIGKD